jgi:hypothetical protein
MNFATAGPGCSLLQRPEPNKPKNQPFFFLGGVSAAVFSTVLPVPADKPGKVVKVLLSTSFAPTIIWYLSSNENDTDPPVSSVV